MCVVFDQEYKRRHLGSEPGHGTLHLTAQTLSISWCHSIPNDVCSEAFRVVDSYQVKVPAMYSESHDASTIYELIENSELELQWKHIVQLAGCTKFVEFEVKGDFDSANLRTLYHYSALADEHNASVLRGDLQAGFIGVSWRGCHAHVFHNIVEHCFKYQSLMGKLYSTPYTISTNKCYRQHLAALEALVEHDFQTMFFPNVRPHPEWEQRNLELCNLILMRQRRTRGATEAESPWSDEDLSGKLPGSVTISASLA